MRSLVLAALVLVVACGDSTGPSEHSVAGTWNLKTINGSTLPFVIEQSSQHKLEVTSNVMMVSPSNTFGEIITFRLTTNGAVTTQTLTDGGTYSLNGTAVSFAYNNGETGTGTLSGNQYTMAAEGFSLVFQKQ